MGLGWWEPTLDICWGLLGWGTTVLFFLTVAAFFFDVTGSGPAGSFAFLTTFFLAGVLAVELFSLLELFESFAEFDSGEMSVHFARSILLDFDFLARGFVLEEDAGGGLVDFLATCSGASDEFFDEVFFGDAEGEETFLKSLFFIR